LTEQPRNPAEKTNQKTQNYNLDLSIQRGHARVQCTDLIFLGRFSHIAIKVFKSSNRPRLMASSITKYTSKSSMAVLCNSPFTTIFDGSFVLVVL
jgi:hypothetical protein